MPGLVGQIADPVRVDPFSVAGLQLFKMGADLVFVPTLVGMEEKAVEEQRIKGQPHHLLGEGMGGDLPGFFQGLFQRNRTDARGGNPGQPKVCSADAADFQMMKPFVDQVKGDQILLSHRTARRVKETAQLFQGGAVHGDGRRTGAVMGPNPTAPAGIASLLKPYTDAAADHLI